MVNSSYAGTPLADITSLSYSTYGHGASTVFAPSLQLDVDYDLTDLNTAWQGRLVYEPYQNGIVTPETWQSWSPLDGVWWASGAPGNALCPQSNPCTWAAVLAAFPNAGIRTTAGNINFKVGGPWTGGFTGNVDAFIIGVNGEETVFNFEAQEPLVAPPTTKDQCKNDGWQTFNNPSFKNQGQCIKYVNGL